MARKRGKRRFAKRNADGTVTIKTTGKTGRPGGSASAGASPGQTPALSMGSPSEKLIRPKNRATPRNQPNSTEA